MMSSKKSYAPVVLFVYNRPEHTARLLQSLSKNPEISQSDLFVFSDGPSSKSDQALVEDTRKVCESYGFAKTVDVIKRDFNVGLAQNIIGGVSEIVNRYGSVIVLEDDLVLSPGFLRYMNCALGHYREHEQVFHISGYWHPTRPNAEVDDYFFLRMGTCWGWATWKRAWSFFRNDPLLLKRELARKNPGLRRFDMGGAGSFLSQLNRNIDGSLNTWAIKWYATIFINDALSLHPKVSFVDNVGHDGSGTNCNSSDRSYWKELNQSTAFDFPVPAYCAAAEQDFMLEYIPKSKRKKNRQMLKSIFGLNKKLPRKWKSFKRLRREPRFKGGEINFLGHRLLYVDGASLCFMIKEIFYTQIYRLKDPGKSPYIIDCGANIGLAAIYWKQNYPDSEILCFEPDKKVFDCLKKNVSRFNIEDVTLIEKALWSSETTLEFFSEGADGGRIKSTHDDKNIVKVQTDCLSRYLYRKVDLLKIDIEGAELTVLIEIANKLDLVENIFIEYHSFVNQAQDLSEIISILDKAGFRLNINSPGLQSDSPFFRVNTYNNMDMQLNIYGYRA